MAAKRSRGLGRGLDALLPQQPTDEGRPRAAAETVDRTLPTDVLHRNPNQPRSRIGEQGLAELAQSIRAQGVIEPLIVRPRHAGGYEIVAGERRWRAAQLAGLDRVPVAVRDVDDRQAMAMALIENIQREDLMPLEEARALKTLLGEYAMTHEALAEAVGKSRAAVSNALRLLKLGPVATELLETGELEMGHARALLSLAVADQDALARRIARQGLSVRQTEAAARRLMNGEAGADKPPNAPDPDTQRLERQLSERLGARTTISANKHGRGQIVIRYASLDELDGVLSRLGAGP